MIVQATGQSSWTGVTATFDKSVGTGSTVPQVIDVPAAGRQVTTGISAAIARLMRNQSTLDFGYAGWFLIGTTDAIADCNANQYLGLNSDLGVRLVCLPYADRKKFIILHEMGHAISGSQNGPWGGDLDGDEGVWADPDSDDRCNCEGTCFGTDPQFHCLNSREFTGRAQAEGFSHFIAAANYNYRSVYTNSGGFGYYKHVPEGTYNPDTDSDVCWYIGTSMPSYQVNVTDTPQWTQIECDPGTTKHLGSEWDWLTFYYRLWADGTNKLNVSEINDIWSNLWNRKKEFCCSGTSCSQCSTGGQTCVCIWPAVKKILGKPWSYTGSDGDTDLDDLLESVTAIYGANDPRRTNFINRGNESGVSY